MSHFTNMKTCFHNLDYLEKALNKLKINNYRKLNENNLQQEKFNLVMNQSNGHDIIFNWNGNEYELLSDSSFWDQDCPVETFVDKIAKQYANEVIVNESFKLGFQPIKCENNIDQSLTVVLQRFNNN